MSSLRGKKLVKEIEEVLAVMVAAGWHAAPISNKAVYNRLFEKRLIRGKLNTLTRHRPLIDKARAIQLKNAGIDSESTGKKVNPNSRAYLRERIKKQDQKINKLLEDKKRLQAAFLEAISIISIKSNIDEFELMKPFLIAIEGDNERKDSR